MRQQQQQHPWLKRHDNILECRTACGKQWPPPARERVQSFWMKCTDTHTRWEIGLKILALFYPTAVQMWTDGGRSGWTPLISKGREFTVQLDAQLHGFKMLKTLKNCGLSGPSDTFLSPPWILGSNSWHNCHHKDHEHFYTLHERFKIHVSEGVADNPHSPSRSQIIRPK